MIENLTEIQLDSLMGAVAIKRAAGYRFVTMTCSDLGDSYDLFYHFDKELNLENLRLKLPKGATLPSISSEYFAAVLVENEIKDLFGIEITGLLLDYQGHFILADGAPKGPFNRVEVGTGVDTKAQKEGPGHE